MRKLYVIAVLIFLCTIASGQDGTKSIKSEEYLQQRPQTSASETGDPGRHATNRTRPAPRSHVYTVDKNFPVGPAPQNQEYVRIGVTFWRFGPNQCAIPNCPLPASGSRSLVDTAAGSRVDDSDAFSTGERVRIGLESLSHEGFIYVIDREQYADGTFGEPYLIFPTRSSYHGNNYAKPGLQIQLPRAEGCFCVKSRNPQLVLTADNLIVIVSPQPLLSSAEIGDREIALPNKLSSYVSRAGKELVQRGSLRNGVGLAQTSTELRAGARGLFDTEPILTQEDLPPQDFYQNLVPRGSAAVFNLYLRYNVKP